MIRGRGAEHLARTLSVLTLFLLQTVRSQLADHQTGNVGCLYSGLVCTPNEVCFNDLVIGQCISASSQNQQVARLGPLEGPPLGLLEAEMSRVFGLGFTWSDIYTQCVFQTLLHDIQNRQPYSKQQCAHLMKAQQTAAQEDSDNILGEPETDDETEDLIYQPDNLPDELVQTEDENEDEMYENEDPPTAFIPRGEISSDDDDDDIENVEEESYELPISWIEEQNRRIPIEPSENNEISEDDYHTRAWIELQQVLNNLQPNVKYELVAEEEDQPPYEDQIIFISPDDVELNKPLEYSQEFSPDLSYYNLSPSDDLPANPEGYSYYVPVPLPQAYFQSVPDYHHPLEKREAYATYEDEPDTLGLQPSSYGLVIPQAPSLDYEISPEDAGYIVPDLYENLYSNNPKFYESLDNGPLDEDDDNVDGYQGDLVENLETPIWNPDDAETRTNPRDRRNDQSTLMQALYPANSEDDVSTYDFEDTSSANEDDNDILYYNPDDEPIPVEPVFDRREREDVKKPGPFFTNSPNDFYLEKILREDEKMDDESEDDKDNDELEGKLDLTDYSDPGQTEYEFPLSPPGARQKKLMQEPLATYEDPEQENNYLYVNIKGRFSSLSQANKLAQMVSEHLQVQPGTLSDFRPETSRILLKVNSNPRQFNATKMAWLLEHDTSGLKEEVKNGLGLEIESFGAGNADSVVSVYSGPSKLFLMLFLLTAGLASLLVVAAVLLLIRRRARMNTKIQEAKQVKEEPVKEYKQLVRDWSRSSRASQGSNGANGGEQVQSTSSQPPQPKTSASPSPNKITQKSAQNSEGSRTSSTSSWQEEPGVSSMDISTGHMVLSYMEDHLKNKQRLEQEWVGLCAYEAEPNSTSVAFKVENKKKNRYPDKLPYDHNRVLLNALVNGSNSDYINASTVMDHDPRNPAYIITQGPMTHTVADFWQMVWEQGSVVIVMLSRLAENGYQLAARYWPEEGSEQYHIFEVHLVSEHVWCDDYLVRSLYLKNSQTGETRTVTQFHFLSWPDSNIPTSTKAILEFRRKVNKSYRGRSCPMIVHCSDGVGRSGTYVLIDMVLNRMMKGSKEIDIAATLEHIRDQRSGMVQTRSQFEFCLMAVAEETHAILKALPQ